jgi:hypothetical protein
MASLVLSGDTSGSITVSAPAVAGSTTQTLVNVTGTLAPIVSGTAVASTSGTSIDFTGIPSWAKRITVMFNSVSLSGTSNILIQIGSGSIVTTGYNSATATAVNGGASSGATSTAGFVEAAGAAANVICGQAIISNISANLWVSSHSHGFTNVAAASCGGGISPTLSDTLDRVRVTTVNGTDTFDSGTINILFE